MLALRRSLVVALVAAVSGSCFVEINDPPKASAGASGVDASLDGSGGSSGAGGSGGCASVTVMRDEFIFGAGQSERALQIGPLVPDRSAVLLGLVGASARPNLYMTRVEIDTTGLSFFRSNDESGGTGVRWTVVELPSAVVQHGSRLMANAIEPVALAKPVAIDRAFPLISYSALASPEGDQFGSDDLVRARLSDPSTLELQAGGPGAHVAWQVVELTDGSRVFAKSVFLGEPSVTDEIGATVDLNRSILLFSYTAPGVTGAMLPNNAAVRGRISSPTSVAFDRHGSTGGLQISWYVIELACASVQTVPVSLAADAGYTTTPLNNPIEPSRAIALASGFGRGGRASRAVGDNFGEALCEIDVTANAITTTRGLAADGGTADFEVYVVEFAGP